MKVTKKIKKATEDLKKVFAKSEDTGDWYGCLSHAIKYLEESLISRGPHEKPLNKKLKEKKQ